MAEVEAYFEIVDNMSRDLERIRQSSERTENQIHDLTRSVNELERHLRRIGTVTARPDLDLDTSEFDRKLVSRRAALAAFGMGGGPGGSSVAGGLRAGPFALGVTGIGLAAGFGTIGGLVAPAAALAQSLAAVAAAAVPAFGALVAGGAVLAGLVIPQVKQVTEQYTALKEAEEAVKNARTPQELAQANQELARAQAALNPRTREAIELVRGLGQEWKSLTGDLQDRAFDVALGTLRELRPILRSLGPIIREFADAWLDAGEAFNRWLAAPGTVRLLQQALQPLPEILRTMLQAGRPIVEMLLRLTAAAAPLAQWILTNLVEGLNDANRAMERAQNNGSLARFFEEQKPVLEAIWSLFTAIVGALGRIAAVARPYLVPLLDVLERNVVPALEKVLIALFKVFGPSFPEFIAILADAIGGLADIAVDYLLPAFELFVDGIVAIRDAYESLTPRQQEIIRLIIAMGIALWAISTNPVIAIVGAVIILIGWLARLNERYHWVNAVQRQLVSVGHALRVTWDTLVAVMQRIWSILRTVWGIAQRPFIAMRDATQWVIDRIQWLLDKIGAVVDKLREVIDLAGSVGGIPGSIYDNTIGRIPGFAVGGEVSRPTLAMVGERGHEVIVPTTGDQRRGRELLGRAAARLGVGLDAGRGSRVQSGPLVAFQGDINVSTGEDWAGVEQRLVDAVVRAARNIPHRPGGDYDPGSIAV